MRALTFFGGVTRLWVPDNLKSWVTRACRYEPTLQHDYIELALHYSAAILPARPRDDAKVETGQLLVTRGILGCR
jgi:transposase